MKVQVVLVDVREVSGGRVEVTVRLGKKEFVVQFHKEASGIHGVVDWRGNFDKEVENLKALGLEVETLECHYDTLAEFAVMVSEQRVSLDKIWNDLKDAENKRKAEEFAAQVAASSIYKGMKFAVRSVWQGLLEITFTHDQDAKAKVVVSQNDKGMWVSDQTYCVWDKWNNNKRRYGDKMSRKNLFSEEMKEHIQAYLDRNAAKNQHESSVSSLEKWIEVNKVALQSQGFSVPYSIDKEKVLTKNDGNCVTKLYLGWKDGQAVIIRREQTVVIVDDVDASSLFPVVAEKVV